jgi:hypothetical protein
MDRDDPAHQHFIFEGVTFPTSRAELVAFATDASLDRDIINLMNALPEREYVSAHDVWRAIGEATRRFGLGTYRGGVGVARDDIGKQATVAADGHVNRP